MPYITPNTLGHYPRGFPITGSLGGYSTFDPRQLEEATDTPDIESFQQVIQDTLQSTVAQDYFSRGLYAQDWWYARWPYQTIDGRKWGDPRSGIDPWPWPGASDTRIRTCEKVIGQHRTLCKFALRDLKWQAKSNRPDQSARESQQATILLNWMIGSHIQAEYQREMKLAISWRNGNGAAILKTDWKQSRLMQYIDVNVMGLQEFVNEPAVQSFLGGAMKNIPIGENLSILDFQEMIMDKAYETDLAVLLRSVSHDYLSLKQARKKLDDLRQLRTVEIPVPYVFESRPRITAYRPMADILFPTYADDLQSIPWYDTVEFVNGPTLRDRIVTANYDPAFVDEALDYRGPTSGQDWRIKVGPDRASLAGVGGASMDNDIELHHFYTLVHDKGVPARYHTVFHRMVDIPALHEPDGYEHGEACIHAMRFETEERPILSSRGIPEIAYTWEQELKAQFDAWVDRTAISMRPPMMTTYESLQKIKDQWAPGVIFPMRSFDEYKFMQPPDMDQVSVMIVQAVENRIREHFAIFGLGPEFADLVKMRREEMVDDFVSEMKPVAQQFLKLMRQLLPDAQVAAVVGPLSRPFHIDREDLQGEFEITGTVDLRDIDDEWFEKKMAAIQQLVQLDSVGVLDKTYLIKEAAQAISYSLADGAITNPQASSNAEIQDEQRAVDLIIGSGQDQPLPQNANNQLRLQTLMAKQQSIQQNPATMKIIQSNPDITKVLLNRAQFFQRQIQQQQNAQIGRMQVSQTFSNDAPQPQADTSAQGQIANAQLGY